VPEFGSMRAGAPALRAASVAAIVASSIMGPTSS
jgi:hypothetical protein